MRNTLFKSFEYKPDSQMVRTHINEPGAKRARVRRLKRDGEIIERRRACARDIC